MEKRKYISRDARTGCPEGALIELSQAELDAAPFNVYLELVKEEMTDILEKAREGEELAALKAKLFENGLSPKRIGLVLASYKSERELMMHFHVPLVAFDTLTEEFLKKHFLPEEPSTEESVEPSLRSRRRKH